MPRGTARPQCRGSLEARVRVLALRRVVLPDPQGRCRRARETGHAVHGRGPPVPGVPGGVAPLEVGSTGNPHRADDAPCGGGPRRGRSARAGTVSRTAVRVKHSDRDPLPSRDRRCEVPEGTAGPLSDDRGGRTSTAPRAEFSGRPQGAPAPWRTGGRGFPGRTTPPLPSG